MRLTVARLERLSAAERVENGAMPRAVRLADLLAGLSIASDLGFGLPPETAMRACLAGTRLARACGLPEPEVRDSFFASLLLHVGCPGFSHETAMLFGNELALTRAVARINLADPAELETTLIPEATRGLAPAVRRRLTERIQHADPDFGARYDTASCEIGSSVARRAGIGASVERALYEVGEWWNGGGAPQGLRQDEISIGARIAHLAADAAVLDDLGSADLAVEGLRKRAGSVLDPSLVETFAANAAGILDRTGDPRACLLEEEPRPVDERDPAELPALAAVFGDVADLKFPALHGHSSGVAALAVRAARKLRVDSRTAADLEVAAHLHDLGRLAVTNAIWEKPGPLTSGEWEQVRMHPYHSERILATSSTLERLAPLVGMHHERLDGSGYHRGSAARDQPVAVRVLAAADAFHAMTEDRPHRARLGDERAADELAREARAGRLDGECVAAVLEVAGQGRPRPRDLRPAGLTDREIEVLRLVAYGFSNPDIARKLVISRRTAEHHVQHIYAKVGVSSRPALALFAMEHDLFRPPPEE
jgi:HD-GYP domain-containing protein (c-di-GMP phosphodiesterase class II)